MDLMLQRELAQLLATLHVKAVSRVAEHARFWG